MTRSRVSTMYRVGRAVLSVALLAGCAGQASVNQPTPAPATAAWGSGPAPLTVPAPATVSVAGPVVAPVPVVAPAPVPVVARTPVPAAATARREGLNVFLSGHSLINLDMPWNVRQLAEANGHTHHYNAQIGIGANLKLRLAGGKEQDASGEPMTFKVLDEIRSARTLPGGRKYDTLIITEASEIAAGVLSAETVKSAASFHDALISGNRRGRVFLYDSWDNNKGDIAGWITRTRNDHLWYQCVASAVNKDPARAGNPMQLLPAGITLARVAESIQSGGVPGLKPSALFMPDGHHASPLGNYLLAMAVYSTIYQRKPEIGEVRPTGRSGVPYADLPAPATLIALRDLVWETGQAFQRNGQHNRRPMSECRKRLPEHCGTVGKFICAQDINRVFAD